MSRVPGSGTCACLAGGDCMLTDGTGFHGPCVDSFESASSPSSLRSDPDSGRSSSAFPLTTTSWYTQNSYSVFKTPPPNIS